MPGDFLQLHVDVCVLHCPFPWIRVHAVPLLAVCHILPKVHMRYIGRSAAPLLNLSCRLTSCRAIRFILELIQTCRFQF